MFSTDLWLCRRWRQRVRRGWWPLGRAPFWTGSTPAVWSWGNRPAANYGRPTTGGSARRRQFSTWARRAPAVRSKRIWPQQTTGLVIIRSRRATNPTYLSTWMPRSVFSRIMLRNTSPLDMCSMSNDRTMRSDTVPLPEPGAPMIRACSLFILAQVIMESQTSVGRSSWMGANASGPAVQFYADELRFNNSRNDFVGKSSGARVATHA